MPVISSIGVELEMGQVGSVSFQDLHGFERRGEVARGAEVVAMEMERMRQMQIIDDRRQAGNDFCRCYLMVTFHRLGQNLGVLSPFPGGDAAGIHCFHSVTLSGPDEPGNYF